ncbi:hypothetical protein CWI36_0003p0090 [Hamiltosporidium magnivora]|uniref:Uncharacterized protein n=1 Tax=Hamiltosporidium magnivora TaxID=148818 RepID=A0A4Q9LP27_9MICR|nr:hypothetical protein CWI36_0003p0090 [Hamiltosporidium magnivora]
MIYAKNLLCSINVKFIEIDEDIHSKAIIFGENIYFLCMKTCCLINCYNSEEVFKPVAFNSQKCELEILYPDEISLEFEFLNEIICEEKKHIEIFAKEKDLGNLIYFTKLLKFKDSVFKTKSDIFLEILKYLKIFRVKRDRNYKTFIKELVFSAIMFNTKNFLKETSKLSLNTKEYDNSHIRDIIECFCKFNLIKKHFLYETFHQYHPTEFSDSISFHKEWKKDKKIVTMQFIKLHYILYWYNYLLNSNFRKIWNILIKIIYIEKLHINFLLFRQNMNIDTLISSLPQKFKKFSLIIWEGEVQILDTLRKYGYFDTIKKFKISFAPFSRLIFEKIEYFKNVEKLTLVLQEIPYNDIINLEKIEELKLIKILKIILCKFIDVQSKAASVSLSGKNNNIYIDLSEEIIIDDSENMLENFCTYNFYPYLTGIDLNIFKVNYTLTDFSKIFQCNLISRLKIEFENSKFNYLNNYEFLLSFTNLKYLYFSNIKLTDQLLTVILKHQKLISILFSLFEFCNEINHQMWNFSNASVLHVGFFNLVNSLNGNFFFFIMKFQNLKHLCFEFSIEFCCEGEIFVSIDKLLDYENVESAKQNLNLPRLISFSYKKDFDFLNRVGFSILHVISFFFDLRCIESLVYNVECLYSNDVDIFTTFKVLSSLDLSIQRNDLNLKFLEKILQSNIKKTIFKLKIISDKYFYLELISILNFQMLKIFEIAAIFMDENIKKYLEILSGMNLIICEIYVLTKISEINYFYFRKSYVFRNLS